MARTLSRAGLVVVLLSALLAGSHAAAPAAHAAPQGDVTFVVNTNADAVAALPLDNGVCETGPGNGQCTLRAAVMKANNWHSGSVYIFLPALPAGDQYQLTIPPSGPDDASSGDLNIMAATGRPFVDINNNGLGAHVVIDGSGLSPRDRVFSIGAGASVFMTALTIQGGQSSNSGGGIENDGTLYLEDSRVTGNLASLDGGGIDNAGILSANASTFDANLASRGGGISDRFGPLYLAYSTVSTNTANAGGGGVYDLCSTAALINTTISGNRTFSDGGGIDIPASCGDRLGLYNVTVADNTADAGGHGGGIDSPDGAVDFQNSILSNNQLGTGTFIPSDCHGTLVSQGYNLISSLADSCGISGTTTGNIVDLFALLRPLAYNGGTTLNHALNLTSPAVDAGNLAGCRDDLHNLLAFDQRFAPRPANFTGVTRCDMGAFELQRSLDLPLLLR